MSVTNSFIGRAEEIGQIAYLLERIDRPALAGSADVYVQDCVVNLHGPPGIGKSTLLKELRARLSPRSTALLIDLRFGLPADRLHQEKLRFVDEVLHALEQLSVPSLHGWPDALIQLHELVAKAEQEPGDAQVDEALAQLLTAIRRRAQQQVILLLVDSCEYASEALFAWLERYFLLPLIHDAGGGPARTVCVFASQLQLRWRQHNVRRRVRAQSLNALSVQATREQVGDDKLGDVLYSLTRGHALANTVVVASLQRHRGSPGEQLRWLSQNEGAVIRRVVEELRSHAAASMLAGAALPEGWESWTLWEMIEPLAVLREFDLTAMRVMVDVYHERFRRLNQSDLLIAIRELLKTRLVQWSSLLRAYQIAPAIRHIFARALALRQPELHHALCETAVQYYEAQVRSVPGNRNLYLAEYLYHRLSSPDTTPEAALQLSTTLTQYLAQYYANGDRTYVDSEGHELLEQTLVADRDLHWALEQHGCPPTLLRTTVQHFQKGSGAP